MKITFEVSEEDVKNKIKSLMESNGIECPEDLDWDALLVDFTENCSGEFRQWMTTICYYYVKYQYARFLYENAAKNSRAEQLRLSGKIHKCPSCNIDMKYRDDAPGERFECPVCGSVQAWW